MRGLCPESQDVGGRTVEIATLGVEVRRNHPNFLHAKFTAPPGFNILFGPSGAGKTTILDCVAGLSAPDSGLIQIGNVVLFDREHDIDLSPRRRRVGYVFQDQALFPHLSVEENVAYGLDGLRATTRKQRASEILESFRIAELRSRRPAQISGGERQRVALARALVTDPRVLLLDEPLTALDASTKARIVDDLRAWNQSHGIPILYVTHSREEVFALGERVLAIEDGKIIAKGTPHEVLSAPRRETVAQLAGFENIFSAKIMATNEARGTMTCKLEDSRVELETPLVRAEVGARLKIGIGAGDILLATVQPVGLSARNLIRGEIASLAQRDVIIEARVNCGVEMVVHLTLAARDALELRVGNPVWLVIKTHSCHLMA